MAKGNFKDNTKMVIIGVAGVVALGVFGYMQLSTTTVYVATQPIMSNTQITEDMLGSGIIKAKSVPRSLTNEASIKNFSEISGQFLKFPLGPGKQIFTYDFAGESDLRNNKVLREQNLEALSLFSDSVINSVGTLSINDRVNIYSIEEIDLSTFSEDQMILVSDLPEDIQKIFVEAGGLKTDSKISVNKYKYSKMIGQNIPVVELTKDVDTGDVNQFVLGVTPNMSENIYLALEEGRLGLNILPYSEKEYKVKDSKGTLQNLQVVGGSTKDTTKQQ